MKGKLPRAITAIYLKYRIASRGRRLKRQPNDESLSHLTRLKRVAEEERS